MVVQIYLQHSEFSVSVLLPPSRPHRQSPLGPNRRRSVYILPPIDVMLMILPEPLSRIFGNNNCVSRARPNITGSGHHQGRSLPLSRSSQSLHC